MVIGSAEVLARCREHSPDSEMWMCDLADPDAAVSVALAAIDHFGHLDVLVNNAAIPKRRFVQALTPPSWTRRCT